MRSEQGHSAAGTGNCTDYENTILDGDNLGVSFLNNNPSNL